MSTLNPEERDAKLTSLELLEGIDLPRGNYRLVKRIASTHMSVVYTAYDNSSKRVVAIKLLANDRYLPRFTNEATLTYGLLFPNIATTIRYDLEGETLPNGVNARYVVMKYLSGLSLSEMMRRSIEGSFPAIDTLVTARDLVAKIAPAIDYLHQRRIFHRDIKPSNILYDEDDPYLIDFGIAKQLSLDGADSPINNQMTMVDERPGTSNYMPPEQWMGAVMDGRGDQYAFAVTLYQLLSNRVSPFQRAVDAAPNTSDSGANTTDFTLRQAWQQAHMFTPPTPLREYNPAVPEAVWQVLKRGMEKDSAARFPNILAFAAAFEGAFKPLTVKSPAPSSLIFDEATSVDLPVYRPLDPTPMVKPLIIPAPTGSRTPLKETAYDMDASAVRAAQASTLLIKVDEKTPQRPSGVAPTHSKPSRNRLYPLLALLIIAGLIGAAVSAFLLLRPAENAATQITLTPTAVAQMVQGIEPPTLAADVALVNAVATTESAPTQTTLGVFLETLTSTLNATLSPLPIVTETASPTQTLTHTPTRTTAPTLANTDTATSLPLPTTTDVPTITVTPSRTPSNTDTATALPTTTSTPTNVSTIAPPTLANTDTATALPLPTTTDVPTVTSTERDPAILALNLGETATAEMQRLTLVIEPTMTYFSALLTQTAIRISKQTPTVFPTEIAALPTDLPTSVATDLPVPTVTPSETVTFTATSTDTATIEPSPTPSPTLTPSVTPTFTPTEIPTSTFTPTAQILVRAEGEPNVPMRSAPNGNIVRPLPTDVRLEVVGVSADAEWLDVRLPDGLTGWVPATAVKIVRGGPARTFDVTTRVSSGTTVQIIGEPVDEVWYPVRLPDGTQGWMSNTVLDYTTPTPVVTPTPTPPEGTPGVFRPRPTVNWTNGTGLRIVTTSQTAWLRSRPRSSDASYTTLANNNPVTATGQSSYDGRQWWWEVSTDFGAVGWIEQGQLVER